MFRYSYSHKFISGTSTLISYDLYRLLVLLLDTLLKILMGKGPRTQSESRCRMVDQDFRMYTNWFSHLFTENAQNENLLR